MGVHRLTDLEGVHGAINPSDLGCAGLPITQISDEQWPAAISDEVTIAAHSFCSLSLDIGRDNRWEFTG